MKDPKDVTLRMYLGNNDDQPAAALFARMMSLWYGGTVTLSDAAQADISVCRDDGLPEEGFRIETIGRHTAVRGHGTMGVTCALAALLRCFDGLRFLEGRMEESPALPIRGVHLYMPGKEDVEGFKRIIDAMALLKLNTLIIEVGGGMEYKKHPEINAGWERFCQNMHAFPGGPTAFQGSDSYWKDSTHTELGGGSFLPQETVRALVDYANAYGIEVVPELQYLSHAYYITSAYPEFAERKSDAYPDTICPNNEAAYQLYFALADEVLAVMRPRMVCIGHDEIRVMGKCETCVPMSGHDLLAMEVSRLHAFYQSRGVRISMWCEKLQNVLSYYTKERFGGVEENRVNKLGRHWHTPAMYGALQKIPTDILLTDWLYGRAWDSEKQAEENGFQEIFGNFHGEYTRGWKRRLASPCVIGGEVSSWCRAHEAVLGHDGIIGDIWFSAMMLWDKTYDEDRYEDYQAVMRRELPLLRECLRGDKPHVSGSMRAAKTELLYAAPPEGDCALSAAAFPVSGIWPSLQTKLPPVMAGVPLGEKETCFAVGKTVKTLAFVHTCLSEQDYRASYNFEPAAFCPVVYVVRYADGQTVFVPAQFGTDIGYVGMRIGRTLGILGKTLEDPSGFAVNPEDCPDPPMYQLNSPWQNSLLYSAAPITDDGCQAYVMEWENPRPDAALDRVFAMSTVKTKDKQALLYCVAAVLSE